MIDYISPSSGLPLTPSGDSLVSTTGEQYPIVGGIPRFVPADNYANAFGLQWRNFAHTQIDSMNGTAISRDRLLRCLGMPLDSLKGKNILEVGSGAGRFTEILVESGANVHSVDLSAAVEVNKENIGDKPNYKIAQANVYELPYPKASFDIVICLGVIQHTPDSDRTIAALWQMVKPGGLLVIDHYMWRLGYYINPGTYWRLVLKELPPTTSKRIVDGLVSFFFPMHWATRHIAPLKWIVKHISPVMTYMEDFPQLDRTSHYEWARLDSYDSLTDYYKHLRTPTQILHTLTALDAQHIWVARGGNGVEARGQKKR